MRVVIAPDKFKGTLTAREVAAAIALGVQDAIPEAECVLLPMADGGDGTLDALEAVGWARRETAGLDARGRPVRVPYVTHDEDAVIEMAAVKSALKTLRFTGEIRPRLKKMVISQKTRTDKNNGEIVFEALW